jgi:anti-sigma regulatory factor (Ser/Thr protein kinase)
VPDARHFVRHTLDMWRPGAVAADCELVASELVTNAVTASSGPPFPALVGLLLAADHKRLFVLVMDASNQPPKRQPHDDDAPSGRGLQLVEALSDRWGWCAAPGQAGKITWAILGINRHEETP